MTRRLAPPPPPTALQLALLALAAAALLPAARAQAWGVSTPLPFARSDHTATALGGSIFIAGGCDGAQKCVGGSRGTCSCSSASRNLVAFTPANASYSPRAPLLQPRYRHLACPLGDASGLVLFGGRTLTPATPATGDAIITAIDVYTAATNAWTQLGVAYPADLGSDNSCTTALDGRIYVMGGYTPDYAVSTRLMYALTLGGANGGSFALMAPMPLGLGDFSSALVPATGNIHVMGGYTTEEGPYWYCRPTPSHFVYSPRTNTWAAGPPLPVAMGEKDDAVLLGGRLFTMGGESKSRTSECYDTDILVLTGVRSYDPAANAWRNETSLPYGAMRLASAEVGGVAYLFGGQGALIDDLDTNPLKYSVLTFTLAPVAAPDAAPVSYSAGAMGGAIAGTLLVTLALAAAAQAAAARCRGGGSGADKNVLYAA
jgi:hypothetical protein